MHVELYLPSKASQPMFLLGVYVQAEHTIRLRNVMNLLRAAVATQAETTRSVTISDFLFTIIVAESIHSNNVMVMLFKNVKKLI